MRTDGYAPIRDYALIGDGRTAALVAADGAIDWLCLPNLDSPSVFGRLLDAKKGGAFVVQPAIPFETSRRYLPNSNVLETTFRTDRGAVRVTDAMTLPDGRLDPARELARAMEGLSGVVPMRWAVSPRFGYGAEPTRFEHRDGIPVAVWENNAVAIRHWNAGQPQTSADSTGAIFDLAEGDRALLALTFACGEPLILPGRSDVLTRIEKTRGFWQEWTRKREYDGPWTEHVRRSALALKLLIFAPSGAASAAPTTSLPEAIGGSRNWDYRFCWIRDSNFLIHALLALGCRDEARSSFWWFLQSTSRTEPELHVLYRLDGDLGMPEHELPLQGYRGSAPVRVGNGAMEQTQLDIYGALFETAFRYSEGHHRLDADTGAVLARMADHVSTIWRRPDSGIWEVRNGLFQFTHSKVMCWVALDRALRLVNQGEMPGAHARRWRTEMSAIETFIEGECWSDRLRSYTRSAGDDRVDASLLMLSLVHYGDPHGPRMQGTIDAVSRELRHGDFVYRYRAPDGLSGDEGCFLNCSFWLTAALARAGRVDEAAALMERLIAQANDVGLYAEAIDPVTGEFLGNFPQALTHLALINAALAVGEAA